MYAPPRKKLNKVFMIDKDRQTERQRQDTAKMSKEQHKLVLQRRFSQLRFELSRSKLRHSLLLVYYTGQMVNSRSHGWAD